MPSTTVSVCIGDRLISLISFSCTAHTVNNRPVVVPEGEIRDHGLTVI